jgi:predicted unusual protein kinase regulating ubiquinone biosynthesis (AarF/ABC1/UbiB family)
LATRSDFFPTPYLLQLKELHDQLPPMKAEEFTKVYQASFANPKVFSRFEPIPIASASIGQVHLAYLQEGPKVAVKLRRYDIQNLVKADIHIISLFNRVFAPFFSVYTKNSIEAVISEFSKVIQEEVSFRTELQNLTSFSEIYAKSGIRFPVAYPDLCNDDALVMSFEEGFRFDDKENLSRYDIDFKKLIAKLVNFYTDQMLITGYFHADPHPGNLLVNPQGELILLDFGMVKRIPNDTRIAIIELIKAANEQDYELYISANKRLGTIAYEAPTAELAEFTAKMFAIFSDNNLSSESMQQLAYEVLESTKDLPFKLPSDVIYILRVSAIIEGLGTTYIENFNGIKDILPILKSNLLKALGAKDGVLEMVKETIKDIPFFVQDLKTSMTRISQGSVTVELSRGQLGWLQQVMQQRIKSYAISFGLIFSGMFTLLYDRELKELALFLLALGVVRILYK